MLKELKEQDSSQDDDMYGSKVDELVGLSHPIQSGAQMRCTLLLFTPSLLSPSLPSPSLWSTSSSIAKCPWSVARCHAQRMMTVKMDDKMIRMARWPGYDKMTQARVLLINPLPCLALSPPCHLARSAGRPQKTPGKKHWHGQVGRKERNLLRKTVSLCNLCVGWHCPGRTFPQKVAFF